MAKAIGSQDTDDDAAMRDPEATFADLAQRFRDGTFTVEANRLHDVQQLQADDVAHLPRPDAAAYQHLVALGQQAIQKNEVGAIILAGGMATRFNYDHPKGLFPIFNGKSFLQLKIEWLVQTAPKAAIFVMTSFHTDAAIRQHLAEHNDFGAEPGQIQCFVQDRFPRLTPTGDLLRSGDPDEDFAAPGHGDFVIALQRTGLLAGFIERGGRYLAFSNVDNLGATLDPAIVGWHINSNCEMTVEVAAKVAGDKGGAPARVAGRLQLVEGFAFPEAFDQDAIPVFNTASYIFTASALMAPMTLPWYVVEKKVHGQQVIQFEHLAGDLSRVLKVGLLAVDRDQRFIPVKEQSDVPHAQELIERKAVTVSLLEGLRLKKTSRPKS